MLCLYFVLKWGQMRFKSQLSSLNPICCCLKNESRETTVIENWILLCPFEKPVWYLGCGVHKINVIKL